MEVLSIFIDALPLRAGEEQKGDLWFQFNVTSTQVTWCLSCSFRAVAHLTNTLQTYTKVTQEMLLFVLLLTSYFQFKNILVKSVTQTVDTVLTRNVVQCIVGVQSDRIFLCGLEKVFF